MLKILYIPDIMGEIGRKTVAAILPGLKKELRPDLVIANAENSAHGKGVTEATLKELASAGIDWFTTGDHAFDNAAGLKVYSGELPILRPANYSKFVPGRGYAIILLDGRKILLINLAGREFMDKKFESPFVEINNIFKEFAKDDISAIIIDIHAETSTEKIALRYWVDGKASAVLGSHTHVMTADQQITELGTAYISDAGMVGFADGIIGLEKENIIKTYLEQIKYPHVLPLTGRSIFNAVNLTIDHKTRKTRYIKTIIKFINIK